MRVKECMGGVVPFSSVRKVEVSVGPGVSQITYASPLVRCNGAWLKNRQFRRGLVGLRKSGFVLPLVLDWFQVAQLIKGSKVHQAFPAFPSRGNV